MQVGSAYGRQCNVAAFQRPSRTTVDLVQRPKYDVDNDAIVERRWCREVCCAVRSVACGMEWTKLSGGGFRRSTGASWLFTLGSGPPRRVIDAQGSGITFFWGARARHLHAACSSEGRGDGGWWMADGGWRTTMEKLWAGCVLVSGLLQPLAWRDR